MRVLMSLLSCVRACACVRERFSKSNTARSFILLAFFTLDTVPYDLSLGNQASRFGGQEMYSFHSDSLFNVKLCAFVAVAGFASTVGMSICSR